MSKVLVVEDEENILRLIEVILVKNGQDVVRATTGEEAILHLERGLIPDLILLDIMMPGIDGLHVLRKIRSHDQTRAVPVVMITALQQESVVLQGIQLGAKDYIRKPFHPRDLWPRIKVHLAAS